MQNHEKADRLTQKLPRTNQILRHQFVHINSCLFVLRMKSPVTSFLAQSSSFLREEDRCRAFIQQDGIEQEDRHHYYARQIEDPSPVEGALNDRCSHHGRAERTAYHCHRVSDIGKSAVLGEPDITENTWFIQSEEEYELGPRKLTTCVCNGSCTEEAGNQHSLDILRSSCPKAEAGCNKIRRQDCNLPPICF